MATVASSLDVYDFESVIEGAAKAVLEAHDLTTYTSADASVERVLPRVEVAFSPGGETGHAENVPGASGELLANEWLGSLALMVIVKSNAVEELRANRAKVRDVAARFRTTLDAACALHSILEVKGAGASPVFATEKGWLACTLRYNVRFGLVPGALVELAAATA